MNISPQKGGGGGLIKFHTGRLAWLQPALTSQLTFSIEEHSQVNFPAQAHYPLVQLFKILIKPLTSLYIVSPSQRDNTIIAPRYLDASPLQALPEQIVWFMKWFTDIRFILLDGESQYMAKSSSSYPNLYWHKTCPKIWNKCDGI